MIKPKEKFNIRLKNKLLPEIDSEANRFRKLHYSEISKKDNLLKNNDSYISHDESNTFNNNQKYISALNDLDILTINNSTNNNTKKSPIVEIHKNNKNPINLYDEIKIYLENFINNYINEKSSVAFVLNEILNAIIIIIKDFVDNNKNNNSSLIDNKNDIFVTGEEENNTRNYHSKINLELGINSKIVFLLKIQKLNNKIKKLKEELDFFKNVIEIPKKGKIGNNFLDLFKKKYMEQKMKSKKEELNYLLCIGEQEKKISSLEKQLNKKEKENLPGDTIKSIRCFPYFHQYDFKEDINPKSIPLFQQFQKEKKVEKSLKNQFFESPKNAKNLSNSIKRKKALNNNNSSNNRSKLLLTNPEFNKLYKRNNNTNFKTKKDKSMGVDNINSYNISLIKNNKINNEKNHKCNNSETKIKKRIINTDSNIINNTKEKNQYTAFDFFKEYFPKTILDNKREFFVAHPTLNIAGVVKKKEVKYVGLPKKIIRLKVHKNLEKNMMVTFPSSLNETLVNLEKLRNYKNNNNEK